MKVVIIGSGNVATVLGQRIKEAGNEILQVIGRSEEKAAVLASYLNCSYATNLLQVSGAADLYILAISDNAIANVASELELNSKLLVHTAASVSKEVLAVASDNYGILYPLQTLKTGIAYALRIPIVVDGSSTENISTLKAFASQWADEVIVAGDEERLKLHVAAVFVSNFTNHLFALAEQYCNEEKLNFRLLRPLVEETIRRIEMVSPSAVQTGPAVRNDTSTIQKHQSLLSEHPQLLQLYNDLSNSIFSFYSKGID